MRKMRLISTLLAIALSFSMATTPLSLAKFSLSSYSQNSKDQIAFYGMFLGAGSLGYSLMKIRCMLGNSQILNHNKKIYESLLSCFTQRLCPQDIVPADTHQNGAQQNYPEILDAINTVNNFIQSDSQKYSLSDSNNKKKLIGYSCLAAGSLPVFLGGIYLMVHD